MVQDFSIQLYFPYYDNISNSHPALLIQMSLALTESLGLTSRLKSCWDMEGLRSFYWFSKSGWDKKQTWKKWQGLKHTSMGGLGGLGSMKKLPSWNWRKQSSVARTIHILQVSTVTVSASLNCGFPAYFWESLLEQLPGAQKSCCRTSTGRAGKHTGRGEMGVEEMRNYEDKTFKTTRPDCVWGYES